MENIDEPDHKSDHLLAITNPNYTIGN